MEQEKERKEHNENLQNKPVKDYSPSNKPILDFTWVKEEYRIDGKQIPSPKEIPIKEIVYDPEVIKRAEREKERTKYKTNETCKEIKSQAAEKTMAETKELSCDELWYLPKRPELQGYYENPQTTQSVIELISKGLIKGNYILRKGNGPLKRVETFPEFEKLFPQATPARQKVITTDKSNLSTARNIFIKASYLGLFYGILLFFLFLAFKIAGIRIFYFEESPINQAIKGLFSLLLVFIGYSAKGIFLGNAIAYVGYRYDKFNAWGYLESAIVGYITYFLLSLLKGIILYIFNAGLLGGIFVLLAHLLRSLIYGVFGAISGLIISYLSKNFYFAKREESYQAPLNISEKIFATVAFMMVIIGFMGELAPLFKGADKESAFNAIVIINSNGEYRFNKGKTEYLITGKLKNNTKRTLDQWGIEAVLYDEKNIPITSDIIINGNQGNVSQIAPGQGYVLKGNEEFNFTFVFRNLPDQRRVSRFEVRQW